MRFSLLEFIRPQRLLRGLRERGLRYAMLHGVRRLGASVDRAVLGPYLLRVNPMGYVCNHACPMCWLQHMADGELAEKKREERRPFMRLEQYVRLFDAMPPGFEELNIVGGGEPLVHPDIVAIMREAKRRGKRGFLITNGTLLREPIARAMVEMGWDITRLSVHAGDAATHDRVHDVQGKFETLRQNLEIFDRLRREARKARQCRMIILNVIQPLNIHNIEAMFAFAARVRADEIVFEKVIPYNESQWLSAEQIADARDTIQRNAARGTIPCNLEEIDRHLAHEAASLQQAGRPWVPAKRCSVGFDQSFITAQGDVMPCCFSDEVMGSLRNRTFRDIWEGKKYREFRSRLINGKFAHYCISNRCTMKGVLHN
jgi:radical SAM protein with 4Fe4S-binding SPASM domain